LALATVVEASGTANSNEADVRINANSFFMVFLLLITAELTCNQLTAKGWKRSFKGFRKNRGRDVKKM
jgi:hypothetical protein